MWASPLAADDAVFDPAAARSAAFTSVGGAPGIGSPAALEVRELAAPGLSLRIAPGTVAIPNRTAGAMDEVYIARLLAEETVAIAATGAAARSDLIVARMEDGSNPAGPTYPDPAGPCLRVISGVPSGTVTIDGLSADRSEYALARIDLPAHTSVVPQDLIVDLRDLVRSARAQKRSVQVASAVAAVTLLADGQLAYFPAEGLAPIAPPSWATHARAAITVNGVLFGAAGDHSGAGWTATGDLRIEWGWAGDATNGETIPYTLTTGSGVGSHTLTAVSDAQPIPLASRGLAGTVSVQARRDVSSASAAVLSVGVACTATVDVEFYTDVESSAS